MATQPKAQVKTRGGVKSGAGAIALATAAILFGVVDVEGGYVYHPSDPGGKTHFGITEAVARADGFKGDMRDLTQEQALDIYDRQYIKKPGFTYFVAKCEAEDLVRRYNPNIEKIELGSVSPSLGWDLIDTGVNAGTSRSARWLQESLNHFNARGRLYPDIAEDGDIGRGTRSAFDALARRRGLSETCEVVRRAVDAKQAQHYVRLFGRNKKFEDFAWGWFRTRIGEKRNPL